MAEGWQPRGADSAPATLLHKNRPETTELAAKKPQPVSRSAEQASKFWNNGPFRPIVGLMESSRLGRKLLLRTQDVDWKCIMSSLNVKLGILAAGLMLSGCMQATNYEATNQTNSKPRDKELLSKVSYVKTPVPEAFRRAIVDYHRRE